MIKRLLTTAALSIFATALFATPALGAFGFSDLDVTFTNKDGSAATQAGSHPFAMKTSFTVNSTPQGGLDIPEGETKNLVLGQIPGLVGNPSATPRCSTAQFIDLEFDEEEGTGASRCPDATAVGVAGVRVAFSPIPSSDTGSLYLPVYNLIPPPGVAAKIGFIAINEPVTVEIGVNEDAPNNIVASLENVPQILLFYRSEVTLWGNPADPAHDSLRGRCVGPLFGSAEEAESRGLCPVNVPEEPFLTLPRACEGPLTTSLEATSWEEPDATPFRDTALTHDDSSPSNPLGMSGCGNLNFSPSIAAKPTTRAAASPTGLDFSLDVKDEGLTSPKGIAQSDIRKAVVTLPEGFSTNPSLAEGLNVCSVAELDRESAFSAPGAGCPNASKIGTVEVETPLLEEPVNGSLFIAKPYENPFGSLLALYLVIKNPTLGIAVTQALKVENDPVTGRITTVADNLPQLPFSHFRLHFREGTRSPLASPPGCGTYSATATLTPSSGGAPFTTDSAFQIITGPGAGACPSGGAPPFKPGLEAGTLNNAAGSYSPFYLRLNRNDGEGEFTRFSIKLPPGITGKLAGIPFCPDAQIAAAKARTGPHGGAEEIASPSCPKASEVGRTLAGAGVGPSLAYAPGKVYLAGPYNGSALSIAAITAAKVGPFDLGTVVIRSALKINPETAEVFVDATGSDPIPHIIKGIPVHARDIRVYVDRPEFVLNPTSCKRTSTASTVLGSGLDFGSASDDQPITVTSPFQAADCASLGFAPKLKLSLKGGTKRGQNPAFKAVLTARKGDANIARAQVTLPHSEFLDQSHIKTICTRVQFNQGSFPGEKCPKGSVYGYAKAITPLLDEPIEGPVFLRSSSNPLPDLVAALHSGKIDFNLVGRIDSVKGGQIRNTFELVPDAPVSKFTLTMQGGKKGLLVNSTNLCKSTNRAIADFSGQNGKEHVFRPKLKPRCGKGRKGKGKLGRTAQKRH
ncbi:MAG: hypothetical protein WA862_09575 [Solirubrobacterales bacterium]